MHYLHPDVPHARTFVSVLKRAANVNASLHCGLQPSVKTSEVRGSCDRTNVTRWHSTPPSPTPQQRNNQSS